MLMMFLIGSVCTIAGTLVGYYIFSPQHALHEQAPAVAGMYTATYIGGGVNFNAWQYTMAFPKREPPTQLQQ